MNTVYFQGTPCHTYGSYPAVGEKAPCYHLVGNNLKDITCHDFVGKQVILNVFPSLDTEVCAASVRRFNVEAAKRPDTVVLCISMDLPFAMSRFCAANNIENVITASAFRSSLFVQQFGLQLVDGPLAGLLARAVIILDKERVTKYVQVVDEITTEPDYTAALRVIDGK